MENKPNLLIIKNPAGTYSFMGSVPLELAYYYIDDFNRLLSIEDKDKLSRSNVPGLLKKSLKIKTRAFSSEQEAWTFYDNIKN